MIKQIPDYHRILIDREWKLNDIDIQCFTEQSKTLFWKKHSLFSNLIWKLKYETGNHKESKINILNKIEHLIIYVYV